MFTKDDLTTEDLGRKGFTLLQLKNGFRFGTDSVLLAWFAALALMVATNFSPLGIARNGKKRWFGFQNHALFQSAELVKIALVVVMAVLINGMARYLRTRRAHVILAFFALPPFVLVAMNNLSSGIIILGIVMSMYLITAREERTFWLLLAGVIGAVAGVIGCLQAMEAVKYITGAGDLLTGRLLTYDALKMQFRTIRLPRDSHCAVCSGERTIHAPFDYELPSCDLKNR